MRQKGKSLRIRHQKRAGGQLNLAKICDNLESYMKPVLKQNSQKLSLEHSGLTGYRLLTDNNGEVFYQQIVQYMQETLGSQGVQALLNRMSDREKKTEEANLKASQAETGGSIDRYDSEMNQASQKSQQAAEEAAKKQQQENASSDQQFGSGDTQTTQPAPAQQNPVNNPNGIYPLWTTTSTEGPEAGNESNSNYVQDGSYLRMQTLTLGYSLPKKLLKKIGFEKIRVYGQISNVFTITGYDGLDPEVRSHTSFENEYVSSDMNKGIDYGSYGMPRQFLMGVNVTF